MNKINPIIFRAYDIRGIYGKDVDENVFEKIGHALAVNSDLPIVIAGDVRISTPSLKKAFIHGIACYKECSDLGILPLGPALWYAWQSGNELAYITASHLPQEWNGIKFFHSNGQGFTEEENNRIRDTVLRMENQKKPHSAVTSIRSDSILQNYKAFLIKKIRPKEKIKIVLDCGNGAAGLIAPRLFSEAGFETVSIFDEPDGSFPNRSPDPHTDDLTALREKIVSEKAAFGIAYDGDGDRMAILDENGKKITPEQISYVILSELLKKEKGPIIANVECTRLIDDIAKKFGCEVIRVPVGHTYLIKGVLENKAVFGVEVSGHYCIPSIVPFDDALAVSYWTACNLGNQKLSGLASTIPRYPFERINFPCKDERKFKIIEELKKEFVRKYGNVNTMDGVRVDFPNGWILIRASNTEPKIRLTIEAKDQKEFEKLKEEFVEVLKKLS